jgi:hypothetical protein
MRCLYCGKELALLKRLTGGAEFCSDAHRKKYQEEFNDLALSRLLQTQAPSPAKPLPMPELAELPPVATPPLASLAAPPKASPKPVTPPPVRAKAPQPTKAPEPKDPVVGITGYLVEEPIPGDAVCAVVGGEPYFAPTTAASLPSRGLAARTRALSNSLSLADPLKLNTTLEVRATRIHPRTGNLEIREFSRQAIAPAAALNQTLQTYESVLPGAIGEAMEIPNQPHPPADPPVLWQAGPHPAPPVNLLLGDLARLDFSATGFGEDSPAEPSPSSGPSTELPPPPRAAAPAPDPVPPAPQFVVPQPVVVPQPPTATAPQAATQPLPVTLHGSSAAPAKPASILSAGVPAAIEPQAPPSSALPLRPTIILAPRPARKPAPAPAPELKAPAAVQPAPLAANPALRPLRGPTPANKNRRPEVRVIQTNTPAATPSAPQAARPAPPPASAPAPVQAAPPPPVQAAPQPPVAKAPVPQPKRAAAPEPPPARPEPARPEIDLHLPELHNPEVQGVWARMPVAVKAGIGGALAVAIIGFAYSAMNSNNASATPTTTAQQAGPSYNLGKQINSGGWIEDWAPADKERRITLLRGSQPYSDYRIEFNAQIQNKAIGWMYRGLNPKNYYVVKLEKLKPGIEPVVALVRYAVIDGSNEKRVETILPMKVRVDTTYEIRFDAVGNEFAVWIQGKKVDEWKDSRLGSGGLGLYSEGEESAAVHGTVNVFELVSTK